MLCGVCAFQREEEMGIPEATSFFEIAIEPFFP
jgi:hypothetical protein